MLVELRFNQVQGYPGNTRLYIEGEEYVMGRAATRKLVDADSSFLGLFTNEDSASFVRDEYAVTVDFSELPFDIDDPQTFPNLRLRIQKVKEAFDREFPYLDHTYTFEI